MMVGLIGFGAICAFGAIGAVVLGSLKRRWDRQHGMGPRPHAAE